MKAILIFFFLFSGNAFSKKVKYKWKAPEKYSSFIVEIFQDAELSRYLLRKEVQGPEISFELEDVAYLRIAVVDEYGDVSDFSNISKLSVNKVRPKPKPEPEPKVVEKKKVKKKKIVEKKEREEKKISSFSIFYAASSGQLDEVGFTGAKSSIGQTSPLTLGLSYQYKNISTSLYLSYLEATFEGTQATTEDNSFEVGGNIYYNFHLTGGLFFYSGVDLERFPTFNTDQLDGVLGTFEFRNQQLGYITGGLSYIFQIGKRNIILKSSFSKSVFSGGDENPLNGENYEGTKFISFIGVNIFGPWSAQAFYKGHSLTGAGDQEVVRYGFGIGYNFW